jgi:hypothetical protein
MNKCTRAYVRTFCTYVCMDLPVATTEFMKTLDGICVIFEHIPHINVSSFRISLHSEGGEVNQNGVNTRCGKGLRLVFYKLAFAVVIHAACVLSTSRHGQQRVAVLAVEFVRRA